MRRGRAAAITREVLAAVARWREFAAAARVPSKQATAISRVHRLDLAPRRR